MLPCFLVALVAQAQSFLPPTANHALFEKNGEEKYFVGTVGKPWTTGTFGCVRTDGWQMHEGLGYPLPSARQARRTHRPGSGHGRRHDRSISTHGLRSPTTAATSWCATKLRGRRLYSLDAILHQVRQGLKIGQKVKAGEAIAIMGRTANTHEGISKERAHVHFELNLLVNDRYASWHKRALPGQRNDHGEWNGQNLLGIDPRAVPVQAHDLSASSACSGILQHQTELCRVVVRKTDFPWLRRYSSSVHLNPVAQKDGVAGYEMALNFNGVAFELIPRSAAEIKSKAKFQLLSVNEAEYHKNPARRLVVKRGAHWELGSHGLELLEMLTY